MTVARLVRALTSFKISFTHMWVDMRIKVCVNMKMMRGQSMVLLRLQTSVLLVAVLALWGSVLALSGSVLASWGSALPPAGLDDGLTVSWMSLQM